MHYVLNDNTFLVNGIARSCIYDFNNSKLYSINSSLAQEVNLSCTGELSADSIDIDLKAVFEEFVQLGIMVLSESPSYHDITEIIRSDSALSFAWIEITNRCNLRCLHCYNESDAHCNTSMSLDDFRFVIDSVKELHISRIQIIGGEPFFDNKKLKEMLNYAVGKFDIIEIFTNGTLVTDEIISYIAEHNIQLALSVYSYDSNQHDKVTNVNGSWNRTNETIKKLKKNKIKYRVCNVLMNCAEVGDKNTDLYELSLEKDVIRMSGRGNFSLLSDELIKKRMITKKTFQTPIRKKFCSSLLSGHNCFKTKIYISADLKVYPCVMERRIMHCDLSNHEKLTLNDAIRNLTKDNIRVCEKCEYRYTCHDCRPDSLSNDVIEKPWYCTYNPGTGEWEDADLFIKKLREQWEK